MNKKRIFCCYLLIVILITWFLPQGVYADGEPSNEEGMSPFQQALQEYITEQEAAGKPVPASVVYEYEVIEPVQSPMLRSLSAEPQGQSVTIIATTTILFENPQQAGYEEWPSLDGDETDDDFNFDEQLYQKVEEAAPDFWEEYEFGQEPRKQTYVETFDLNYATQEIQPLAGETNTIATDETILMGFTYAGPSIDKTISDSYKVCVPVPDWLQDWIKKDCSIEIPIYSIRAGFWVDFSFGLRLPAAVNISSPEEMELGKPYDFSATLTPLDWTEEQFEVIDGDNDRDGSEFFISAGYFVGLEVKILDYDVCQVLATPLGLGKCYIGDSIEKAESFTTPFGTNSSFNLPSAEIPFFELGLSKLFKRSSNDTNNNNENDEQEPNDEFLDKLLTLEAGLQLTPKLTSTRITANWQGIEGSNCEGNGLVTFTEPNQPVTFGPVVACGIVSTEGAGVRLSDFRYYFTNIAIDIGIYIKLDVIGSITVGPVSKDFYTFDLSQFMGSTDIYIGDHKYCEWVDPLNPFECSPKGPDNVLELSIPVFDRMPPVTTVSLKGLKGNNDWYRSDVEVSLSAVDNLPDCADAAAGIQYSFDNSSWNNYTSPITVRTEGMHTLYYKAMDAAGNVEDVKSAIINVDKTQPSLSVTRLPPPNSYGWNNTTVIVHFNASDDVSGVDTVTPDQIFTQEGAGQTISGTATDLAGNSATITVNDINIDKTAPTLKVVSPQSGTYPNITTLTPAWATTDNLSGIAVDQGLLDGQIVQNGQTLNLLLVSAGSHTFIVKAVDKADNTDQISVSLSVTTDINGLIAAKEYMCELGWITKQGVCNSLDAKLEAAKRAIDRGSYSVAINQLTAFINELIAQNGKAVEEQAYHVLRADALYVVRQLRR